MLQQKKEESRSHIKIFNNEEGEIMMIDDIRFKATEKEYEEISKVNTIEVDGAMMDDITPEVK